MLPFGTGCAHGECEVCGSTRVGGYRSRRKAQPCAVSDQGDTEGCWIIEQTAWLARREPSRSVAQSVLTAFEKSSEAPVFKSYFLRVDPQCRPMLADGRFGDAQEVTALNAVASTFGMTGAQYVRSLVAQT